MGAPFKLRSGNSPVKFDFFKGKTKEVISKYKSKAKKVAGKVKSAIQDPITHGGKVLKGADLLLAKAVNPVRAAYEDIKHYKKTGKVPKLSEYETRVKWKKSTPGGTMEKKSAIDIIKEIGKKGLGYEIKK